GHTQTRSTFIVSPKRLLHDCTDTFLSLCVKPCHGTYDAGVVSILLSAISLCGRLCIRVCVCVCVCVWVCVCGCVCLMVCIVLCCVVLCGVALRCVVCG